MQPSLRWGMETVPEAKDHTYMQFSGGDAKPVGGGGQRGS